jgi:hypothetical protein
MKDLILGNRVPYEYFITSGSGQSNVGSEGLPYETGSYDEALTKAGVENANIIEYTSVIPTGAKQISKEKRQKEIEYMLSEYSGEKILNAFKFMRDERSKIDEVLKFAVSNKLTRFDFKLLRLRYPSKFLSIPDIALRQLYELT